MVLSQLLTESFLESAQRMIAILEVTLYQGHLACEHKLLALRVDSIMDAFSFEWAYGFFH